MSASGYCLRIITENGTPGPWYDSYLIKFVNHTKLVAGLPLAVHLSNQCLPGEDGVLPSGSTPMLLEHRMKTKTRVGIVDDDPEVLQSLSVLLDVAGYQPLAFASGRELLAGAALPSLDCLLIDVRLADGEDGIRLLAALRSKGVIVTAHGDVPMAVRAMRAGATDFIEKPYTSDRLLKSIAVAREAGAFAAEAAAVLARLTPRERQVLIGLTEGKANKVVAAELGISPRTVETYRADIMEKLGTHSLAETVRIALAGGAVIER